MRDARQVFWGIATALVSIALLLGGLSLSLVEGNMRQPTSSLMPTVTSTWQPSATRENSNTPEFPTPLPPTSTTPAPLSPTFTPTPPPPPTNCPLPKGWVPYVVQPGDTLDGLALRYKKTSAEISAANCLGNKSLLPGLVIYLPPLPTRTPTPCGPPPTWVIYIVQHGDTLYHLGEAYGIPYKDILTANCLTSSTIFTGQRLYVPPWATRTPSPTFPGYLTPTDSFFITFTPSLVTPTETVFSIFDTPTDMPTSTDIIPSTGTPTPTPTQ